MAIGNRVNNLGSDAFYDCYALKSITIPGYLTNLGTYALAYCTNLTAVYFQGNAPTINGSPGRG